MRLGCADPRVANDELAVCHVEALLDGCRAHEYFHLPLFEEVEDVTPVRTAHRPDARERARSAMGEVVVDQMSQRVSECTLLDEDDAFVLRGVAMPLEQPVEHLKKLITLGGDVRRTCKLPARVQIARSLPEGFTQHRERLAQGSCLRFAARNVGESVGDPLELVHKRLGDEEGEACHATLLEHVQRVLFDSLYVLLFDSHALEVVKEKIHFCASHLFVIFQLVGVVLNLRE
mmetsp:Transcript_29744/g.72415  ORF Transcript_29744/g.72415 Transcript_29744/m.72415 type:complete len:232 (-) Transcript_29744:1997-2692(-)